MRPVTRVLSGVRGAAVANPVSLSVAGTFLEAVAAYHSARAFFCQLSSQKSQALIGSGQGAWDL